MPITLITKPSQSSATSYKITHHSIRTTGYQLYSVFCSHNHRHISPTLEPQTYYCRGRASFFTVLHIKEWLPLAQRPARAVTVTLSNPYLPPRDYYYNVKHCEASPYSERPQELIQKVTCLGNSPQSRHG